MIPVFGNALIEPIIDRNHAERWEVIAWGLCFSVGILFCGLAFLARIRGSHRYRQALRLLVLAALFHFSGCYISSQDKWQEVREKLAAVREPQW